MKWLGLLACLLAPAAFAATPDATTLLRQMTQAHRKLGVASIQISIKGGTQPNLTGTIRRNDSSHYFVEESDGTGSGTRYCANGEDEVRLLSNSKTYDRDEFFINAYGELSWVLTGFEVTLGRADHEGKALPPSTVTEATLDGEPVYRIEWKAPMEVVNLVQSSATTLVVGRHDSLLRELTADLPMGTETYKMRYSRPNIPFPSSTFSIQLPNGVKEREEYEDPRDAKWVGKAAAPFSLSPPGGGKPVGLSGFKGKTVMFVLWATWCGPCRKEMPLIIEAYKQFKPRGLEIVAVATHDDEKKVKEYVATNHVPFTVLMDPKDTMATAYEAGLPTTVFIGPNGKITLRESDYSNKGAFWRMMAKAGFRK
jgi:thiol-disulfide isomerase/thioredoxin